MATTHTAIYEQTALTEENQQKSGRMLQEQLTELLDLTLQARQAHWNVYGPYFRSIHFELDDLVSDFRTWSDTVAERMVAIGVPARGQAEVLRETPLEQLPAGPVRDRDVIKAFVERLAGAAKRGRERMESLGETDLVSQAIVMDIVEGLEKHLWMLRAQEQQ